MKHYIYTPVGFDLFTDATSGPLSGERVRKVQPPMTPRNGTMGHCYAEPVSRPGDYRLVLEASLRPAPSAAALRRRAAILAAAEEAGA